MNEHRTREPQTPAEIALCEGFRQVIELLDRGEDTAAIELARKIFKTATATAPYFTVFQIANDATDRLMPILKARGMWKESPLALAYMERYRKAAIDDGERS